MVCLLFLGSVSLPNYSAAIQINEKSSSKKLAHSQAPPNYSAAVDAHPANASEKLPSVDDHVMNETVERMRMLRLEVQHSCLVFFLCWFTHHK